MYTSDDREAAFIAATRVRDMMNAVLSLEESIADDSIQTTLPIMDQIMTKAYNTLHEYMMYRDGRMKDETR